jgi:23S rRNA pseudouridine1911/1915/1917 synthase
LDWLLQKHPDTPRSRAKQWIQAGRVSVQGVIIRKPHQPIPDPGNGLELRARNATTLDCGSGWQIHPRVSLLHLDAALAIVNKGPGLISVPAEDSTISALSILEDFLSGKLKGRDPRFALPAVYRRLQPLPVHRLDQYTSGVFCMATNPAARQHLIDQLRAHTMKREYVAFVEGISTTSQGSWRQRLELSRDELRQHVVSGTQSELRRDNRFITKLRLRLETGRKHQIRVQAANAGLPLVGDRTYNPGVARPRPDKECISFPRQALHAEVLTLEHPDQPGVRMSWTAELPKDLRELETALRAGSL